MIVLYVLNLKNDQDFDYVENKMITLKMGDHKY